ncbi:hypothetical protein NC651_015754 [Populus alba x Populus x berolinensis]|nr:hypothetical protein NC651_015754 [Populus alba x Populus x berolinensis]
MMVVGHCQIECFRVIYGAKISIHEGRGVLSCQGMRCILYYNVNVDHAVKAMSRGDVKGSLAFEPSMTDPSSLVCRILISGAFISSLERGWGKESSPF